MNTTMLEMLLKNNFDLDLIELDTAVNAIKENDYETLFDVLSNKEEVFDLEEQLEYTEDKLDNYKNQFEDFKSEMTTLKRNNTRLKNQNKKLKLK